jgi:hypothetical protein
MGVPVIAALLKSGFDVTAITRPESTAKFPVKVTVKKVDTTSADALTEALKGQDAVISTVGTAAAGAQKIMIDAAVAAHVKRFIPSEFGYNLQEARGTKVGGLLKAKLEIADYLIELSQKHEWFTWTGLSTGTLFDWVSGMNLSEALGDVVLNECRPSVLAFSDSILRTKLLRSSTLATSPTLPLTCPSLASLSPPF